jgi:hypothetical protein
MQRIISLALALGLTLAPVTVQAEKLCFRIVNRTKSPLKIENKEGERSYPAVKPYSLAKACCDPLYERLCFDKSDGSSKIKVKALVGEKAQEYSGQGCRKIYIQPGAAILVTRDMDGTHVNCKIVPDGQHVDVAADFDDLDKNNDGKLDKSETQGMDMQPMHYSQADHNNDKVIDKQEYRGFLQKVNIFRGVNF